MQQSLVGLLDFLLSTTEGVEVLLEKLSILLQAFFLNGIELGHFRLEVFPRLDSACIQSLWTLSEVIGIDATCKISEEGQGTAVSTVLLDLICSALCSFAALSLAAACRCCEYKITTLTTYSPQMRLAELPSFSFPLQLCRG